MVKDRCPGSLRWISDDSKFVKAAQNALHNQDDPTFFKLIHRKIRCPNCRRRLQPKTCFDWFCAHDFVGIRIPEHKPKGNKVIQDVEAW